MAIPTTASSTIVTPVGGVHVERGGTGARPLIAITPIGAPWLAAALPAAIGELFTVHIVELPGTGRSNAGPEAASVESVTACVAHTADHIAGRDAVLFGHSMNGALALAAGAAFACAGLIAVAPPSQLPPDPAAPAAYWEATAEPERKARAAKAIARHEQSTDDAEKAALQREFDRLRRWYDLDFDPTALDSLMEFDASWVGAVFESGKGVDWAATLRQVEAPVLLAFGEYDFVAPPTAWAHAQLPARTTVETFTRSGHTPFLEQPDEFVVAVDRWLSSRA